MSLGEHDRQLANMIRIGVVSQLDEVNARVKVQLGGLTTDWLPWVSARAGATRTWSAPRPGEQVVVLSPYGDTGQGVVLPSIYQDNHPAPAATKDKETTVFPDGTTFEHDSATNTFTQTVAGSGNWIFNCQVATIIAATKVQLTTPLVECSADMKVNGDFDVQGSTTVKAITSNAKNIGSTHTHGGVQTGGGTTGVPT